MPLMHDCILNFNLKDDFTVILNESESGLFFLVFNSLFFRCLEINNKIAEETIFGHSSVFNDRMRRDTAMERTFTRSNWAQ